MDDVIKVYGILDEVSFAFIEMRDIRYHLTPLIFHFLITNLLCHEIMIRKVMVSICEMRNSYDAFEKVINER
jgi:hypothetical protein